MAATDGDAEVEDSEVEDADVEDADVVDAARGGTTGGDAARIAHERDDPAIALAARCAASSARESGSGVARGVNAVLRATDATVFLCDDVRTALTDDPLDCAASGRNVAQTTDPESGVGTSGSSEVS